MTSEQLIHCELQAKTDVGEIGNQRVINMNKVKETYFQNLEEKKKSKRQAPVKAKQVVHIPVSNLDRELNNDYSIVKSQKKGAINQKFKKLLNESLADTF